MAVTAASKRVDDELAVEHRNEFSARCSWTIPDVKGKIKQKAIWSKYFDVGGHDCRLLLYPGGDSQALPGYISVYLQITDPAAAANKWECFTSYRLCIENQVDPDKSVSRDSWHRFSPKKKSHGWCDFTPSTAVLDTKAGFCHNDSLVITADILLLKEEYSFQRDADLGGSTSLASSAVHNEVLSGKFTWRVHNISQFMEVMSMQKIMSPVFPAGDCQLRLSVYQSLVNETEYLSMCLESKDLEKPQASERSCWCLFRMSVQSHKEKGGQHMLRDSYGRFSADARTGDNTSLGWNDFMLMADFLDPVQGFVSDDGTAVFCTSFHIIKEHTSFVRNVDRPLTGSGKRHKGGASGESFQGKFLWKIENFTKLKDLLKKRKITSLCIKSRRFQVGGKECRLIVYPRGQSQPPMHLSMFLEVTDARNQETDWSCFVSHRLSVVNQVKEKDGVDKSVSKESQNRYSKAAKDWGWREFVTLTSLFDTDLGFLVNDMVVLCAEVLILKESCDVRLVPLEHDSNKVPPLMHSAQSMDASIVCPRIPEAKKLSFIWKIDNFLAFKEILETRKIFSKYFTIGDCELRIGVYESFDTLCIYLESESQAHADPQDNSYWVRYRIAAISQRRPEQTEWKESSICTRSWNNSVLQFIKVPDMLNSEKGYLVKDSIILACDILECMPWLEFGETDLTFSEPDKDAAAAGAAVPDAPLRDAATASASLDVREEELFKHLLGIAGLQFAHASGNVTMTEEMLVDTDACAGNAAAKIQNVLQTKLADNEAALQNLCVGMKAYLTDSAKVHQLAHTTVVSTAEHGPLKHAPSVLGLLLSVPIIQQPLLDLLLAVLLHTCHKHAARVAAAATPPRPQAMPQLVSADEAARLRPVREPAAAAARWDAICNEAHACATHSGRHRAPDTWSPAAVFVLVQPHQFILSYQVLAPLLITAGATEASSPSDLLTHVREIISILTSVMKVLDPWVLQNSRTTLPDTGIAPPSVEHMQSIMQLLPSDLRPYVAMLVPVVINPREHTMAAGMLLQALADAALEGSQLEAEMQLPVCTALGMLQMEQTFAANALSETLTTLPSLPAAELPGALALTLKLANECPALVSNAVGAARRAVAALGLDVSLAVIQVMCLAIIQHHEVASGMLADIQASCEAAASAGDAADADMDADKPPYIVEMELLLEVMMIPHLRDEAETLFELCVARGRVTSKHMDLLLERRRMQHLLFRSLLSALPSGFSDTSVQGLWRQDLTSMLAWTPQHSDAARGKDAAAAMPAAAATANNAGLSSEAKATAGGAAAGADAAAPALEPFSAAWTANLPSAVSEALTLDIDDFDVLLDLAAWLSHSSSPVAQEFTYRLYLRIFTLWPGHQGRVRMLHALVHRAASCASFQNQAEPVQLLLPVQAGSIEGRTLLAIVDEYQQYASVVLLCLLDLLSKQSAAYAMLCMQKQITVDELGKAQEEALSAKSALANERRAFKTKLGEAEASSNKVAAAAQDKQVALQEQNGELREQVARLEAEVHEARRQGSLAQTRASAAAQEAAQAQSAVGSLEEEVKRLRAQASAADKRRQKDLKQVKELETRLSAAEAKAAERDGAAEAANKAANKAQSERQAVSSKLQESSSAAVALDEKLKAANATIAELQARIQAQEAAVVRMQEDRSQQRFLLPTGLEADLDADDPPSPSKRSNAAAANSTPNAPAGSVVSTPARGMPAHNAGGHYTGIATVSRPVSPGTGYGAMFNGDYGPPFMQGPPGKGEATSRGVSGRAENMPPRGDFAYSGNMPTLATAPSLPSQKGEAAMSRNLDFGGAQRNPASAGINPAAKPFVASMGQRKGGGREPGPMPAGDGRGQNFAGRGVPRSCNGAMLAQAAPPHSGIDEGAPRGGPTPSGALGHGFNLGLSSLGFVESDTGTRAGAAGPPGMPDGLHNLPANLDLIGGAELLGPKSPQGLVSQGMMSGLMGQSAVSYMAVPGQGKGQQNIWSQSNARF